MPRDSFDFNAERWVDYGRPFQLIDSAVDNTIILPSRVRIWTDWFGDSADRAPNVAILEFATGAGNDRLQAGVARISAAGGKGDDWIAGGTQSDTIQGQKGHDSLYGSGGSDTLEGGTGADSLWGGAGDDFLYVGQQTAGVDRRETQGGHRLYGGAGNDVLDAWSNDRGARDTLYGGGGADRFHVQNGDEIADMGRGDEAWVLNARPADWMVASRLGADAVAVTFHNRKLGVVTDLRIEGAVAPAMFDVRYEAGGSITVLKTGAADAASRAQYVSFSQVLSRTVESLRNDVVPVGWEITGGVGADEAFSRLMIDKAEDILPVLTRQIGEKAAEGLIELAGGVAGVTAGAVVKHLTGDYEKEDMGSREIALQYAQDIGAMLLTARLGIAVTSVVTTLTGVATLPVWGSVAVGVGVGATVVVGVKVFERFWEQWFDAVEETLQAEADPNNIAESIYFNPVSLPAPPADDGLLL